VCEDDRNVNRRSAMHTEQLLPARAAGVAQEGNVASTELEKKPGQAIDPAEEPSVEWGWHGGFPKGTQIMGWFSVIAVLAMLIGNHQGILSGGHGFKTEDAYLIGTAVVLVIGLLFDLRRKKTAWRR
jgi:uncharacterized protein DUF2631